MTSPIDPLKLLGQRMAALANELGVDMHQFLVVPDLEGDAHQVQVVFVLPDLEEGEEEHPETLGVDIDAETAAFMAEIEAHEAEATKEERDAAAIEKLLSVKDRLREGDE